jgi:hypothetical protein
MRGNMETVASADFPVRENISVENVREGINPVRDDIDYEGPWSTKEDAIPTDF